MTENAHVIFHLLTASKGYSQARHNWQLDGDRKDLPKSEWLFPLEKKQMNHNLALTPLGKMRERRGRESGRGRF